MYYLTYRPRTVDEIDNTKVREALKNYLCSNTIPHSWLFTGGKGMGKTSTARILAVELNKRNDPSDERLARDIEVGSHPDVMEINGADSTGIDDVRQLIQNASYAPMSAKYRVYIIDEVHQLSIAAFNGLLKILEEPPEHAVFILASTEIAKIPATIQSRCVRIDFGTALVPDIVRMLERIEASEKLSLTPELKEFIARHCDRSFRDAAKILEELVSQNSLTLEAAQAYLGARANDSLLTHLAGVDAREAITWLHEFGQSGGDVKLLIEQTIHQLHAILLKLNGIESDHRAPAVQFTIPQVVRLLRLFHDAYALSRVSPIPITAVQIAVMEYYQTQSRSTK